MDRRTFLSAMIAAPCVSFAGRLSFCQDADKGPEWYRSALKAMKDRRAPGLVLVGPAKSDDQNAVGYGLWAVVTGPCVEAHELLVTSVLVCLTPELAERVGLRKADEKMNRFLIDADGKRLAADEVGLDVFAKPETFAASFAEFVYGAELARLKERAAPLRRTLPEDARLAIELLDSEQVDLRENAARTLQKIAPEFAALFAMEHRTTASAEVRGRLKGLIETHYQARVVGKVDGRLPYGTRVPEFKEGGCGGFREVPEEGDDDQERRVACGMGHLGDEKVKKLLRFLTK